MSWMELPQVVVMSGESHQSQSECCALLVLALAAVLWRKARPCILALSGRPPLTFQALRRPSWMALRLGVGSPWLGRWAEEEHHRPFRPGWFHSWQSWLPCAQVSSLFCVPKSGTRNAGPCGPRPLCPRTGCDPEKSPGGCPIDPEPQEVQLSFGEFYHRRVLLSVSWWVSRL